MTHDEAYIATLIGGFRARFGKEIRLCVPTNAMQKDFERVDGKPLTKSQVAWLDGVTCGFWTRHVPVPLPGSVGVIADRIIKTHVAICTEVRAMTKAKPTHRKIDEIITRMQRLGMPK
jgi:hypothetical protein